MKLRFRHSVIQIAWVGAVIFGAVATAAPQPTPEESDVLLPSAGTTDAGTEVWVGLVPVSVDAPPGEDDLPDAVISLSGNDLVLSEGGHNVWLEFRIGDWDPDDIGVQLNAWSVALDASSLETGVQGELTAYTAGGAGTCATDEDCAALLGPGADCDPPGYYKTLQFGPGYCSYFFDDKNRTDFVYSTAGAPLTGARDLTQPNVRIAAKIIFGPPDDPEPYPEHGLYAATLTLHVPVDAIGSFTVTLLPHPESQLVDQNNQFILPMAIRPATITVQTGRCCFSVESPEGSECTDTLMTAGACAEMPGATEFTPNASCSDVDACPNPPGRCCFGDGCVDTSMTADICAEMPGAALFSPNASCSDSDACSELLGRCCSNIGSPKGADCNVQLTAAACAEMPGLTSFELGGSCEVSNPCYDCGVIAAPAAPSPETHAVTTNSRYLSLVPGEPGVQTALQVTLVESDLFPGAVGMTWWVGEPSVYCENGADLNPPCSSVSGVPSSTFLSSGLQCDPHCMDFGSLGEVLHVGDPNIVPGSQYEVRAISCVDAVTDRNSCSDPLPISTSRTGDTVLSCGECPCGPPEGVVNIVDCKAVVDRFVSAPCAPIKARVDLEPGIPDRQINITDVLECFLSGFVGVDYSLSEPQRCAP